MGSPGGAREEALEQFLALLLSWPERWKTRACPGSCLSPALVAVLGNSFLGILARP